MEVLFEVTVGKETVLLSIGYHVVSNATRECTARRYDRYRLDWCRNSGLNRSAWRHIRRRSARNSLSWCREDSLNNRAR